MRIFEITVLEKSTGKFNVSLLETKGAEPKMDLTTNLSPEDADQLIDDLNLVLKRYFKDYDPIF